MAPEIRGQSRTMREKARAWLASGWRIVDGRWTGWGPGPRSSIKYCLAVAVLFAVQVTVATFGAFDLALPDLPSPLPLNTGRAIHLTLSVFWPFLGLMGGTYFFLPLELGVNLWSPPLANVQFWLYLSTVFAVFGFLLTGVTQGREYLDAPWPVYLGIGASLLIFALNLFKTMAASWRRRWRPVAVVATVGVLTAIFLFIPGIIPFHHPTIDEYFRFWIVHLWEEVSFELIGGATLAAAFISMSPSARPSIEKLLYVEVGLTIAGGLLATGHHYYWIGVPAFWVPVGAIFSGLQAAPVLLIAWVAYRTFKETGPFGPSPLAFWLLASSAFWHLVGAGGLGLLMSIPSLNRLVHGTLLTSAHAHLALFGVFGFLALGVCQFILAAGAGSSGDRPAQEPLWTVIALNLGLALMGAALSLAGWVHAYLERVAGLPFSRLVGYLQPYLLTRAAGGAIFTIGGLALAWNMLRYAFKRP